MVQAISQVIYFRKRLHHLCKRLLVVAPTDLICKSCQKDKITIYETDLNEAVSPGLYRLTTCFAQLNTQN